VSKSKGRAGGDSCPVALDFSDSDFCSDSDSRSQYLLLPLPIALRSGPGHAQALCPPLSFLSFLSESQLLALRSGPGHAQALCPPL
jgi:hypothetical protein